MFRMYDVQLRHAETRRGEWALGFLCGFSFFSPPPPPSPLFFFPFYLWNYEEGSCKICLFGPQCRKCNKYLRRVGGRKENVHWCVGLRGSVPSRRHCGAPTACPAVACLGRPLLGCKFTWAYAAGEGLLEIWEGFSGAEEIPTTDKTG